jgi:hypothetical protein
MNKLAYAVVGLLLSSIPAASSPHEIHIGNGGFIFSADWDTTSVTIVDQLNGVPFSNDALVDVMVLGTLFQGVEIGEDEGEVWSSLTTYGGGILRADFQWKTDDGTDMSGVFEAPILSFAFDLGEQCDAPVAAPACGDVYVTLGRGSLDRSLARAIGVSSLSTRGGTYWVFLENIRPAIDEFIAGSPRRGNWNGSILAITAVPEPTGVALLAAALAGLAIRHRAKPRRQ